MATGFGGRGIRVEILIDAPSSRVWNDISDLASHVEWMEDARSIEFASNRTSGKGTKMVVETKVGRFNLEDEIVVTVWDEPKRISVQHDGTVQGNGTFLLTPDVGGTLFSWDENLLFPLYLGGPLAELIARPKLKRIWENSLASLKDRIEMRLDVNPVRFFAARDIELITHGEPGNWTVDLVAPHIDNFDVKSYATGATGFAARVAAQDRWISEEEPNAERT